MVNFIGEKDYKHGSSEKTGVLITNLGTPDAPNAKSLKIYLNEFLSDQRVIEYPKILWQYSTHLRFHSEYILMLFVFFLTAFTIINILL